jgi:hypothetical protein
MAGAGRKIFTAGDVLTASQVQDYLQDQSVMNFAGTAARSSAIPTPTQGMVSYVADVNEVEVYNGTSWFPLGGMTLISETTLTGSTINLNSIPQNYKDLIIVIRNFRPATDNVGLFLRFNADGAARYVDGISLSGAAFSSTSITVSPVSDNGASQALANLTVKDYANTTTWKILIGNAVTNNQTTPTTLNEKSGISAYNQVGGITSITLFPSSGNFTSGTVFLYGVN